MILVHESVPVSVMPEHDSVAHVSVPVSVMPEHDRAVQERVPVSVTPVVLILWKAPVPLTVRF